MKNDKDKLSVVIPTLQKNRDLLMNLLSNLERDVAVGEVIVIDNTGEGLESDLSKVRVIVSPENLYVNPSWNLGVRESKYDAIALLNDDITLPEDFCGRVLEKMSPDMGAIGFNRKYIIETHNYLEPPAKEEIFFEPIPNRCMHWGVSIFLYKSSYFEIPEDIKIFFGDDWLVHKNRKAGRQNYGICGQNIYHYGSLTSASKKLSPVIKNDKKLYHKLTKKWYHNIFHYEVLYEGVRLTILGVRIVFHSSKIH